MGRCPTGAATTAPGVTCRRTTHRPSHHRPHRRRRAPGGAAVGSSRPSSGWWCWAVGVCVRLVSSPGPYPPDLDYGGRKLWDRQRQYGTVACTDPGAEGRVVAQGAQYTRSAVIARRPIESGCPDDADFEMHVSDQYDVGTRIWCVRNLAPPHVADPGQGGGRLIAGDCLAVDTSDYTTRNDLIRELPCTELHFATVLATAPDPAGCPDATLSRLPNPTSAGSTLCLGGGGNAMIVGPGECIDWPSNRFSIVQRKPCTDYLVYRGSRSATGRGTAGARCRRSRSTATTGSSACGRRGTEGRQEKSAGVNGRSSTSTIQLPELSRATASTPYGRSSGCWRNCTPFAVSSS